jgi:hypothetical protein
MKILQQAVKVRKNQIIQVHFDKPVVVKLLSKGMFPKYKNGVRHVCQGGFFEHSPAKFTVPYDGVWHAVIEKGSYFNPLSVKGRVEILPPEIKEPVYFDNEPEEDKQELIAAPIIETEAEHADETNEEEEDDSEDDDDER